MELVCIVCPKGCRLTVRQTGETFSVSGNGCPRGAAFAKTECTAPVRTVTTTVHTVFKELPCLPVRTDGEIPKQLVPAAVQVLGRVLVTKPPKAGDVIVEDLLATGVRVVATETLRQEENE